MATVIASFDTTSEAIRDEIRMQIGDIVVTDNSLKANGTEAYLTDAQIDVIISALKPNVTFNIAVGRTFKSMASNAEAVIKAYDRWSGTLNPQQIITMWEDKGDFWLGKGR